MASIKADAMTYEDRTLTEAVLRIAKEELGEIEDVREKSLHDIRRKIDETKYFHPRKDDEFLLRFLRVAKFDVGKALDKLKNYYKIRAKHPELFEKMHSLITPEVFGQHKCRCIMPVRNKDNSAVLITNCKRSALLGDASSCNHVSDLRSDLMFVECSADHPATQICGVTVIGDLKGMDIRKCLAAISPKALHVQTSIYRALPMRMKCYYFVNVPAYFVAIYKIIYPFLTQKFRSRVMMHRSGDSWKDLHSRIVQEALPEEYGGLLGPLDDALYRKLLLDRKERFKEDTKYGYTNHA